MRTQSNTPFLPFTDLMNGFAELEDSWHSAAHAPAPKHPPYLVLPYTALQTLPHLHKRCGGLARRWCERGPTTQRGQARCSCGRSRRLGGRGRDLLCHLLKP